MSPLAASRALLLTTALVALGLAWNHTATAADQPSVKILMNWFIQADQGGFWQSQLDDAGKPVAIEVIQGGPKIQTIPQVASGQADFGIAVADDVTMARLHGVPVRAVFAYLDHAPYDLVYHPDPKIKSIADLKDKTFSVSLGFAYWEWTKQHFGLAAVHEIPVSGDLTLFRQDPNLVQQGYSLYLPARMEAVGIQTSQFKIADLGYRPYSVLFTTDEMIAKHPEIVRAVVAQVQKGWQSFLAEPARFKTLAMGMNNQIPPDINDKAVKEIGADLVAPDRAKIGCMSDARWSELDRQMIEAKLIPATYDIKQSYTLTMLPGCR